MIHTVLNREHFNSLRASNDLKVIMLGSRTCPSCADWEMALGHIANATDVEVYKLVTEDIGGVARELVAEYMPYTGLFKDGKVLYSFYGRKPKQEVLDKITELR